MIESENKINRTSNNWVYLFKNKKEITSWAVKLICRCVN